jgi:CheY-like chemotaxis protein
MDSKIQLSKKQEPLSILLVGNNPIDLSRVLEKLNQLHGSRVITEIAFDIKSIVNRLLNFKPNFILIDDNIGKTQLTEALLNLSQGRKTKNIPITVLKNSNYHEAYGSAGAMDYVLKTNLSAESLYSTLRNSLKLRKTQQMLYKIYQRRNGALRSLLSRV